MIDDYRDAQIVTKADFPHGLRCADCDREMEPGEHYSARLEGFVDEVPLTVLTCELCALSDGGDIDTRTAGETSHTAQEETE